ncbi:hypothetical protein STEG23_008186, partial [Scotinomys teguina]
WNVSVQEQQLYSKQRHVMVPWGHSEHGCDGPLRKSCHLEMSQTTYPDCS